MPQPQAKKPKMMSGAGKNKNYYVHRGHHQKKLYMEPGMSGFLATCNFKEKDAVREAYNILNEYADELYGSTKEDKEEVPEAVEEEEDISDALDKAITENKEEKKLKAFRFQAIDTGVANCVFVKTTLQNPVELGTAIAKDLLKTKEQKTRHLLRLIPIEVVCKANTEDIVNAAGKLFDKYFLKEGKTFSIVYNKRYNNSIKRDDIIHELATLVSLKNCHNKVNLSQPQLSVVVEVLKGLCCLSVVEDWIQLRKYNLIEIANVKEEDAAKKDGDGADDSENKNDAKEEDAAKKDGAGDSENKNDAEKSNGNENDDASKDKEDKGEA